jgi:hypothetical protein
MTIGVARPMLPVATELVERRGVMSETPAGSRPRTPGRARREAGKWPARFSRASSVHAFEFSRYSSDVLSRAADVVAKHRLDARSPIENERRRLSRPQPRGPLRAVCARWGGSVRGPRAGRCLRRSVSEQLASRSPINPPQQRVTSESTQSFCASEISAAEMRPLCSAVATSAAVHPAFATSTRSSQPRTPPPATRAAPGAAE